MTDPWRGRSPEENEAAEKSAFAEVLTELVRNAKQVNGSANSPISWMFEMKKGTRVTPYDVWLNPCFLDSDGQPQALIVDIGSEGVGIQECLALATWENGKPTVLGIESYTRDKEKGFPGVSLAKIAKSAVSASYAVIASQTDGVSLPPPPGPQNGLLN